MFLWRRNDRDEASPVFVAQAPMPSGLDRVMEQRRLGASKLNRDCTIVIAVVTTRDEVVVVPEAGGSRSLAFALPSGSIDMNKKEKEQRERATEILLEKTGVPTSPANMVIHGYLKDKDGNKSDFVAASYQPEIKHSDVERIQHDPDHAPKGVTTVDWLASAITPHHRRWLGVIRKLRTSPASA